MKGTLPKSGPEQLKLWLLGSLFRLSKLSADAHLHRPRSFRTLPLPLVSHSMIVSSSCGFMDHCLGCLGLWFYALGEWAKSTVIGPRNPKRTPQCNPKVRHHHMPEIFATLNHTHEMPKPITPQQNALNTVHLHEPRALWALSLRPRTLNPVKENQI